jgi:hypothetical protein
MTIEMRKTKKVGVRMATVLQRWPLSIKRGDKITFKIRRTI